MMINLQSVWELDAPAIRSIIWAILTFTEQPAENNGTKVIYSKNKNTASGADGLLLWHLPSVALEMILQAFN